MDLFTRVVEEGRLHPNFKTIERTATPAERKVLTDWADGFLDRDGKFVKELQTTFNSGFWELYLFACFKELGFAVDFSHPSPDFVLSKDAHSLVAEAVIASHPEGYRPEWERLIDEDSLSQVNLAKVVHLASVRLANSLAAKHKKYLDDYRHLAHVKGRPYLVCVGPFEQPYYFAQNDNALRRVLYGHDQPIWTIDSTTGERVILGESLVSAVDKDSGASIPLGLFTDDRMKEVSAVVFSSTIGWCKVQALADDPDATIVFTSLRYQEKEQWPRLSQQLKKDYRETVLDGLHVCLNPFASVHFDPDLFQREDVAVHWYDPRIPQYYVDSHDGFLFQRACMTVAELEGRAPVAEPKPRGEYREVSRPPWPDGELRSGFGEIPPFVDNHLAHYRGWTAVVAFDVTDADWMAQAVRAPCFSIVEFSAANADAETALEYAYGGFPSKEEALAAVIQRIDAFEAGPAGGPDKLSGQGP